MATQSAWGGGYTSPLSAPPSQYGNASQQNQTFAQQNYQPLAQPTAAQTAQSATARTNPTTAAAQPPQSSTAPSSGASYYQNQYQYQNVANWYKQYLGRTPSYEEVQGQLHNFTPEGMGWQNLNNVQYAIQNSPEAQAYAAHPPAPTVTGAPAGTAPAPYVPPAGTDFNGYAAPGYVASQYSQYAMPGWDQAKWQNAQLQDPKYVVGRILNSFPPTPAGLQQAMALIAQAYPGTQLSGKDTLIVPGLAEPVDVLRGASAGGQAWQWLTPSEVARNAATAAAKQAALAPPQVDPTIAALQQLANSMQMPALQPTQQQAAPQQDNSALQAQIAQLMAYFQQQQQQSAQDARAASLAARTPQINYY